MNKAMGEKKEKAEGNWELFFDLKEEGGLREKCLQ
jgi:hypothetical protein